MEYFDKISIAEMNKKDMLLIIKALEFTGNNTNDNKYIDLKNSILEELSELANCSESQFIDYLNK